VAGKKYGESKKARTALRSAEALLAGRWPAPLAHCVENRALGSIGNWAGLAAVLHRSQIFVQVLAAKYMLSDG
jgi:hypothetical protein